MFMLLFSNSGEKGSADHFSPSAKNDSDSLLAGSGLHQIDFDLVQWHGAYSVHCPLSTACFARLHQIDFDLVQLNGALRPVVSVYLNIIVSEVAAPSGGASCAVADRDVNIDLILKEDLLGKLLGKRHTCAVFTDSYRAFI